MTLAHRLLEYFSPRELIDTSPRVSDVAKYTTCYMCACRCGIKVHLKDGAIRYIEGNRDHPVNRGVICGKGASGIMQQASPAKLRKPLNGGAENLDCVLTLQHHGRSSTRYVRPPTIEPASDAEGIDRLAGTTCEMPNIVTSETAGPAQS